MPKEAGLQDKSLSEIGHLDKLFAGISIYPQLLKGIHGLVFGWCTAHRLSKVRCEMALVLVSDHGGDGFEIVVGSAQ